MSSHYLPIATWNLFKVTQYRLSFNASIPTDNQLLNLPPCCLSSPFHYLEMLFSDYSFYLSRNMVEFTSFPLWSWSWPAMWLALANKIWAGVPYAASGRRKHFIADTTVLSSSCHWNQHSRRWRLCWPDSQNKDSKSMWARNKHLLN